MTEKVKLRTLYGKPAQELMTTRYLLPSGMVEEVFLQAQRQRVNPSQVIEEAVRHGLPHAAAMAVTARLNACHATLGADEDTPTVPDTHPPVAPTAACRTDRSTT